MPRSKELPIPVLLLILLSLGSCRASSATPAMVTQSPLPSLTPQPAGQLVPTEAIILPPTPDYFPTEHIDDTFATEVVGVAVPYEEPSPTPLVTPAAMALLPDPCILLTREEIETLFPKLPDAVHQEVISESYMGYHCLYQDTDTFLGVSTGLISYSDVPHIDYYQNRDKFPIHFTFAGSDIYQAGGFDEQKGNGFIGMIVRGDLLITVTGFDADYQYTDAPVTALLETAAGRLPDIPLPLAACSLITVEEVALLFPNPPEPVTDTPVDPPATSCLFRNDRMDLILSMSSAPQFAQEFQELKQTYIDMSLDYLEFNVSGADVFLIGSVETSGDPARDAFIALIHKGDQYVAIMGSGVDYDYDPARESTWLERIVNRLP